MGRFSSAELGMNPSSLPAQKETFRWNPEQLLLPSAHSITPPPPCLQLSPCVLQAVLQACDRTGSVCVVLWNSVCVSWYRRLELGDIISLRRFRVKQHYQAEVDDIGTKNSGLPVETGTFSAHCKELKPGSAVMTRPVSVAEVSVNSRNPAAQLCVVSESSVSPESVPPAPSHSFYNRSASVCPVCPGPNVPLTRLSCRPIQPARSCRSVVTAPCVMSSAC